MAFARSSRDKPIGIVGGGLAGLCCADRLREWDDPVIIFEASDSVGGRVRTDEFNGFKLDRGFQVLLTAYPEAKSVLRYEDLRLGSFYPGMDVRSGSSWCRVADPRRKPAAALKSLMKPLVGLGDGLKGLRLETSHSGTPAHGSSSPTTLAYLKQRGFSDQAIERFFRPLFGGIFLETELSTASAHFEFVFDMFAHGDATLPADGMGAIPRQIAKRLPKGSVRTGCPVVEVGPDSVTLLNGDRVECSAVVVATDADTACELLPELGCEMEWNGCTTVYFAADRAPTKEPILCLRGEQRPSASAPINHVCVPSLVCPSYAPAGQHLISATIVGVSKAPDSELVPVCMRQLQSWFGGTVQRWKHLRTYRVNHAVPRKFSRGGGLARSRQSESGVYVAGDWQDNPSINGAMRSGRKVAELVLRNLSRAGQQPARTG